MSKNLYMCTALRQNISLLSWNIQDTIGDKVNKFEVAEFLSLISNHSIICLQETKTQVKIEGFISFNKNRKNSRSGGVCILIKNHLKRGISLVSHKKSESDDIITIKLDKNFFRMEFDLYIVCFYISPVTSSIVKKDPDYTNFTFETLNTIAQKLKQKGEILLCGDANARTATLPDYISSHNTQTHYDIYNDIGYEVDSIEPRNNCDKITVAPHCQLFLDFVINNQLRILNGRTLGDSMGKMTCHKWNGSSAVDYFVISPWANDLVNSLSVQNLNSYSDHCPLVLKMTTHRPFLANFNIPDLLKMSPRYKWDNNSPEEFKKSLSSPNILTDIEHIINHDYGITPESNEKITADLTSCLQKAAESSLKATKKPTKLPHKKWFDSQCYHSKRNLNRLACRLSSRVNNNSIRAKYYTERNKHSRLIKKKRFLYLDRLNKAIEDGHVLNWKKFKQLKHENDSSPLLDKFDLVSFYEYFSTLYDKKDSRNNTFSPHKSETNNTQKTNILNKEITTNELQKAVKDLKKGKSCSTDLISNEMLQNLNSTATSALLKVFNNCLSTGKYPWHTSVITPIYKSGNPSNPDNYRAIAVGSCLGKLFSSILLDRLLLFKELYCPDPKEQLGFQKNAQTNDHILTLKTLVDKYTKKQRVRLYACFVDLKKAFDTVSRDLLLHKIANLDISGEFFHVLSDMYEKSIAKIKIANLLSPEIKILRGTEQGHPLSPDLFKLFIRDMSSLFKTIGHYPHLNNIIVSHLLWADDLVLLALDPKSLQNNIDILSVFCNKMGLEVNIKKTKIVTFCPTRQKPLYESFTIGNTTIDHVSKYCYLGILFDRNGSFTSANSELRAKALRGFYGLKNNIIKDSLSFKSTSTLFDTLIKPILLYGCQILAPHQKTMKYLYGINNSTKSENFLKYLSQDHYERFHIKFLKWNLSVHSKASNAGCWGESGRYPLFFETTKLAIDYFERIQDCYENSDNSLLAAAFSVQKELGLDWYTNITKIMAKFNCYNSHSVNRLLQSRPIRKSISVTQSLKETFVNHWKSYINTSPKLEFYSKIKHEFSAEEYLSAVTTPAHRAGITRIRISAHHLYVERGRYTSPLTPRESRWCVYCKLNKNETFIEDEAHVLLDCPLYQSIRLHFFGNQVPLKLDNLFPSSTCSNKSNTSKIAKVGEYIHSILEANQNYTQYYNSDSQDFHNNTGHCVLL